MRKKTRITIKECEELLARAVAEKGKEYIYYRPGRGLYFCRPEEEDGILRPDCIIGHVLHYLGVTPDLVREGIRACAVILDLFPDTASRTLARFNEVQARQDSGRSWGKAVSR